VGLREMKRESGVQSGQSRQTSHGGGGNWRLEKSTLDHRTRRVIELFSYQTAGGGTGHEYRRGKSRKTDELCLAALRRNEGREVFLGRKTVGWTINESS